MAAACVAQVRQRRHCLCNLQEGGTLSSSLAAVCLFVIEPSRVEMWKASFVVLAALVAVGFGALIGGSATIDARDEGAQNALRFAVGEHNKRTNDVFLRGVDKVLQVKRQVCNILLICRCTTVIIMFAQRKLIFLWFNGNGYL